MSDQPRVLIEDLEERRAESTPSVPSALPAERQGVRRKAQERAARERRERVRRAEAELNGNRRRKRPPSRRR